MHNIVNASQARHWNWKSNNCCHY